jgi:hypothetical protein
MNQALMGLAIGLAAPCVFYLVLKLVSLRGVATGEEPPK